MAVATATLSVGGCTQQPQRATGASAQPCYEIQADVDEAQQVLFARSGTGVEGRQALRTILAARQEHPQCFDPADQAYYEDIRAILPKSHAEETALRQAEQACGELHRSSATTGGPTFPTPQQALDDTDEELPPGDPEQSFRHNGQVAFDYYDGNDYQGWALLEETNDGWYVRRTITCGIEVATEEDAT